MLKVTDRFTVGRNTYQVTDINELEGMDFMRGNLEKYGKEPRIYHAARVLKNGKLSEKVGGVFYRFTESGNMISML